LNSCRTGGCTLTGALAVTSSVLDAVTIVHGPVGCAHHNFSLLHVSGLDARQSPLPSLISTALDERDIIFGGEDALRTAIMHAGTLHPEAIFVLSSCAAETIGDDVQGICAMFPELRICVVPTAGFLGGSFEDGFSKALIALAGTTGQEVNGGGPPGGVNLIGEKNLEYEVEQHYAEVARLLGLLGLPVRVRFVHRIKTGDLGAVGSASLNVLRDPGLKAVGDVLLERFGTPYVGSFPVGLNGTCMFLQGAGERMDIDYAAAVQAEKEDQARMLASFDDLAGCQVGIPETLAKSPDSVLLDELVQALDLSPREDGPTLSYAPPFPVGTSGIRRMLHRWRRVLHA
jgi:nitrogenase molybdenum-iron protein alpha/beta subunit